MKMVRTAAQLCLHLQDSEAEEDAAGLYDISSDKESLEDSEDQNSEGGGSRLAKREWQLLTCLSSSLGCSLMLKSSMRLLSSQA